MRWLVLVGGAVVALTGCADTPALRGGTDAPTVFVASEAWVPPAGQGTAAQRHGTLRSAIERLRRETASGWTGRQDDVTGYLADLRGGTFVRDASATDVVTELVDSYGPDLFATGSSQLRWTAEEQPGGITVVRGAQVVGEIPVVDGHLLFTVADRGGAAAVTAVRGRTFEGVDVPTTPTLTQKQARRRARDGEGGHVRGAPRLVVLPQIPAASLTWEVPLEGAQPEVHAELVYVDAHDGTIVERRPAGIGFAPPIGITRSPVQQAAGQAGAGGEPVELTGRGPAGEPLRAAGTRTSAGIELRDTTLPFYDPATGRGAITTHDAGGAEVSPGPVVTVPSAAVDDPEALGAHAYTRYVLEYFHQVFGRTSWDGEGGTLVSTVRYGGPDFCNAAFDGTQMIYGPECVIDGERQYTTFIEPDTAGHEVGHGVINTSSDLLYQGQSGALNESFADYFGKIIANAYTGTESPVVGELTCAGLERPTQLCTDIGGVLGMRSMLNGATFTDYLYLLSPPPLPRLDSDEGGVHLNSAIWNNALWTIRTRLARIDGVSTNESVRARTFDQVVYAAVTRHLGPTSGFLDARAAIEQAAVELGVEPTISDVIRETMDLSRICAGCVPGGESPAVPVGASAGKQGSATVAGDEVAWVDYSQTQFAGRVVQRAAGAEQPTVVVERDAFAAAHAGDALVVIQAPEGPLTPATVLLQPDGGAPRVLHEGVIVWPYLAGSAEGAAWIDETNTVHHVDAQGQEQTVTVPGSISGPPSAIGAGGNTVAVGFASGEVFIWPVGGEPRVVTPFTDEVVSSVAAHGDRVLAVGTLGRDLQITQTVPSLAVLIDAQGTHVLSDNAAPFGAALSDRYVAWSQRTAELQGAVAAERQAAGTTYPETDLYLYSLTSGTTYQLLRERGQQGYPSLSGNRLTWVDAVHGGDDVFTATLPEGL